MWSSNQLVNLSVSRFIIQLVAWSVGLSVSHTVDRSVGRSFFLRFKIELK